MPESDVHLAQRLCVAYGESTTAEEEEEQQEFNHRNRLLLDFCQEREKYFTNVTRRQPRQALQ